MEKERIEPRAAWIWPALIIGYFAIQIALRTAIGGTLGLDDAEIMLDAQSYRMGYGPQLPLYGWLQHTVFLVTGSSIFGLSLLKNIVLCTMVMSFYALLRTSFDPKTAFLGTASLILVPQISWESQRALTHSSVVTCMAVVMIAVVWCAPRFSSLVRFVLLGVVLAVGFLAKYNFAIPAAAALGAAATMPRLRRAIYRPGLALSAAIALLLLYFPISWVLENPSIAFGSAYKLEVAEEGPAAGHALSGTLAFIAAFFNYAMLPLLVIAGLWLFGRDTARAPDEITPLERYLWRVVIVSLALVAIGIALAGVTAVKDRWLQPVLIAAAPPAVLWLLPRLSTAGKIWLECIYLILAALIVLLLPYHFNEPGSRLSSRFDLILPQITARFGPQAVLLAPQWEAGNLLALAPPNPIVEIGGLPAVPHAEGMALVWHEHGAAYGEQLVANLQAELPGAQLGPIETYSPGAPKDGFALYAAPIILP